MTLPEDRAYMYNQAFPDYPSMWATDKWLHGIWLSGNNYKGSGYYGAYPPGYEKRIMSMFPDAEKVLHLFSGSIGPGNYDRFDRRTDLFSNPKENPEYIGEAERLSTHVPNEHYDLILADPPYSEQDARRYGTILIDRARVMAECYKVLKLGGNLCWMDQALPMYRKAEWQLWGLIGMVRSTNHRYRMVSIFEKQ